MIFKVEGPGLFYSCCRRNVWMRIRVGKCPGFREIDFTEGSYLPVFFEAVLAVSAEASASSSEGTDQPPPRAL